MKTLEDKPDDATHWSTRGMAKETGLSQTTITRIWGAFGLQPHRAESFKLSTDPFFVEKVRDIVGLYLDPPERAMVLCVDEKSQIQALNRFQPILPMMAGTPERRSHDYVRHGTTSLFAALDMASGRVIGSLRQRHRATEFKKFLVQIDQEVPADLDVHLILDNYATHKTPEIRRWLLRHPRFHLHFTPTSGSWLNMVERWFAELTTKKIKRGAHTSVARTREGHQGLDQDVERRPSSLRVGQDCRPNPRRTRPLLRAGVCGCSALVGGKMTVLSTELLVQDTRLRVRVSPPEHFPAQRLSPCCSPPLGAAAGANDPTSKWERRHRVAFHRTHLRWPCQGPRWRVDTATQRPVIRDQRGASALSCSLLSPPPASSKNV